jgi:hypothetical protein
MRVFIFVASLPTATRFGTALNRPHLLQGLGAQVGLAAIKSL